MKAIHPKSLNSNAEKGGFWRNALWILVGSAILGTAFTTVYVLTNQVNFWHCFAMYQIYSHSVFSPMLITVYWLSRKLNRHGLWIRIPLNLVVASAVSLIGFY